MTMAPLAARRLEEMVELGARVASIELMLAAQACDLRGARLGVGTARLHEQRSAASSRSSRRARSLPDLEPLVERDPLGKALRLTMAGVDVHQHLLPRAFSDALAAAHRAAIPRRRRPARCPRALRRSTSAITTSRRGSRCSTATRSTRRRLAAADARSRRARRRRSASTSCGSGRTGILELAAAAAGPDRCRSRPAGRGPASRASRRRGPARPTSMRSRRRSTRSAGRGFLFVHPSPATRRPRAPAVVAGRRRLHEPDAARLLRLARRRAGALARRHASSSRSSPAARPIQLERLASRGVDVRSVASPERVLRHRLVRPARARAVHRDVRRRAARLRHATPRSSTRRRRSAPSMRFGESVDTPHPSGQPDWIAAVNQHRDMARRTSRSRSRPHAPRAARARRRRSAPRSALAATTSATTWPTGTTSSCTATPTSTSG